MKVRCCIGSLRLNDGTDYSEGDVFTLDDEKTVQSLLRSGYVQEVEKPLEKVPEKKVESKTRSKFIRK